MRLGTRLGILADLKIGHYTGDLKVAATRERTAEECYAD
jgi:hypothetical protein